MSGTDRQFITPAAGIHRLDDRAAVWSPGRLERILSKEVVHWPSAVAHFKIEIPYILTLDFKGQFYNQCEL
jgi:hypothetical protein